MSQPEFEELPTQQSKVFVRPPQKFTDELLAERDKLRAFAISLSSSVLLADDLVQETLLRAWTKWEKFTPDTSLRAWLFTILRNIYYSNYRKRTREVQDSEGAYARRLSVEGNQESHLDLEDFRRALETLPGEQQEVVILVGANGLSYEGAAAIMGVEIGTIKSRLSRARKRLTELLESEVRLPFGEVEENVEAEPHPNGHISIISPKSVTKPKVEAKPRPVEVVQVSPSVVAVPTTTRLGREKRTMTLGGIRLVLEKVHYVVDNAGRSRRVETFTREPVPAE